MLQPLGAGDTNKPARLAWLAVDSAGMAGMGAPRADSGMPACRAMPLTTGPDTISIFTGRGAGSALGGMEVAGEGAFALASGCPTA